MKKISLIPSIALALGLAACSQSSSLNISDATVKADLEARQAELNAPEYFAIFDQDLDSDVRQCLEFLYAYMPTPDITDYPSDYYVKTAEMALKAREEMSWGKTVPDREFRHFVLPVRVNNENLDDHREVFYNELKDRVAGLSMKDAILEVNHWCHEKACYEPSDSRTHSPLATICSGIGRCGEESTFGVAALRSVGIPARQVYTPRWAHTDDNHAWVEAWADGEWYFFGACEPEAILNLGWFNAPAARGMLMNTRTLGRYDGPEEKLLETDKYTDINVTSNYAAVDTLHVTVVDADGNPMEGSTVDFRLYNYAELYPIASKKTGTDGQASIVAGLGDLIAWASNGKDFAYAKASVGKDKEIQLTIKDDSFAALTDELDIIPPTAVYELPQPTEEAAAANALRLHYEDSIRNAYVATFSDKARGYRGTLDEFINSHPEDKHGKINAVLATLSDKDWTDVPLDVLAESALDESAPDPDDSKESNFYYKYVISPRVAAEHMKPYRKEFEKAFSQEESEAFRANPELLAQWTAENIKTDLTWQPATVSMSPSAVWNLKRSDVHSRNIFFVAMARSLGIPSRLDPVTGKPQYADAKGNWIEASHLIARADDDAVQAAKAQLQLTYDNSSSVTDPGYYTHFTLSKIVDGRLQLLNYDEDATMKSQFGKPQQVDAGKYLMLSGQRLANGGVLAHANFFELKEGEKKPVKEQLHIRQDKGSVQVIGNFNSENLYYDLATNSVKSLLSTTGRGYYVLGVVRDGHEPSNHTLRDIIAMKDEFEAKGIPMVILFNTLEKAKANELAAQLPSTAAVGALDQSPILDELCDNLELSKTDAPIFVIADTFNRVVFASSGYTIGLGRQILDTTNKIE